MTEDQVKFENWAIVELFGHSKAVGFVTAVYFGTACLFRVDTPALPERDVELKTAGYVDGIWVPAGSIVRRAAVLGRSKLVGPSAIFGLNPCDEETAMRAIEELFSPPLKLLKLADPLSIAAGHHDEDEEY